MKTETLKELGLTDEQIQAVMKEMGQSVNKEKAKIEVLTEQLNVANAQIDKFKDVDVDALKGEVETYKKNFEKAKTESETKLKDLQRKHTAEQKANALKFSSESAKKNFLNEVLSVEEDKFDDFVKKFKETDPGAFIEDNKPSLPNMPQMAGNQLKTMTSSENTLRSVMGLGDKGE